MKLKVFLRDDEGSGPMEFDNGDCTMEEMRATFANARRSGPRDVLVIDGIGKGAAVPWDEVRKVTWEM